jgi:FdhD protein
VEPASAQSIAVTRLAPDGQREGERSIAVEMPIALSFFGIGYAVMMATPADLEDFAVGFALSERLIAQASDVRDIRLLETEAGLSIDIELAPERRELVFERVRHRIGESSCGLCGIENLEQALRPLPRVAPPPPVATSSIFAALQRIRDHQPLNFETGAVHAAALFGADGELIAIREDVGRHNAFDKLIGGALRGALDLSTGFVLLTSRCSYELVEKAALAQVGLLVTVSAPTSLAVARAEEAGLTLVSLARSDEMLVVADPSGLFTGLQPYFSDDK